MTTGFSSRRFLSLFILGLLLSFSSFAGFKLKHTTQSAQCSAPVPATRHTGFKDKIALLKSYFKAQTEKHAGNTTSAFGVASACLGLSGILLIALGLLATTGGIFLAGCILGLVALPLGIIGCTGKKRMKSLAVLGIVLGTLTLSFVLLIIAAVAAFS